MEIFLIYNVCYGYIFLFDSFCGKCRLSRFECMWRSWEMFCRKGFKIFLDFFLFDVLVERIFDD